MSKLSKNAFAVMAMCPKSKEYYGITVDPRNKSYAFCWAFKIKKEQAVREGYDSESVSGSIIFDSDYNGCPYCGTKNFYMCNCCGKIVCYDGREYVTCPNCGNGGYVSYADEFNLSGGGY